MRLVLILCAISCLWVHPVSADQVILTNGDRLSGRIVSESADRLVREHAGRVVARLANPVREALGRDEHRSGLHVDLAIVEHELAFSLEYVIDLVHSGVRVEPVFLAGLEGVQPHQNAV